MNKLSKKIMNKLKKHRDKIFELPAELLIKIGINANLMTFFSLILGLLAIYYLFNNHILFVFLMVLHLLADGLDGVIARKSKTTVFGQYFDQVVDRIIAFLVLLKIYLFINDYYVIIILIIFTITQIIYFWSKLEYPIMFIRTTILIILAFEFYPFTLVLNLPIVAYLTSGVVSLYSLVLQFQYYLKRM